MSKEELHKLSPTWHPEILRPLPHRRYTNYIPAGRRNKRNSITRIQENFEKLQEHG
jgi:hypothetical protein